MKNILRTFHHWVERPCVAVIYRQNRARRERQDFKAPWWFSLASKVEFKLRYLYKKS